MLKMAKMFKSFFVTPNTTTNYGVRFEMVDPILVQAKNDNFATQVQILVRDNVDPFEYKYITFDESAFFEITDVIQNGEYATLFIQYVSNIKFSVDGYDENFAVSARTPLKMQELGLSLTDILGIIGDYPNVITQDSQVSNTNYTPFIYAIKIRLSEIPKNLIYGANAGTLYYKRYDTNRGTGRSRIANGSLFSSQSTPSFPQAFRGFDNAITAFLFIPMRRNLIVNFNVGNTTKFTFTYTMSDILNALDALISDLTLSVEITPVNSNSICVFDPASQTTTYRSGFSISQSDTATIVTIRTSNIAQATTSENPVLKWVRFVYSDEETSRAIGAFPPVILTETDLNSFGIETSIRGFWESLNYISIQMQAIFPSIDFNDGRKSFLNLSFMGNSIDLSKVKKFPDNIRIKRENGYVRIFLDESNRIYQDIEMSVEYAKNAYSNYNAYRAANIDLINKQKFESMQLAHEQQKNNTVFNTISKIGDTAKGVVFNTAFGGGASGIVSLVNGVTNIVTDNIKTNMQQQNEIANSKLQRKQELELARATVVPSSEIHGNINTADFITNGLMTSAAQLAAFSITYASFTSTNARLIEQYVFKNQITEKYNTFYSYPSLWGTQGCFQVDVINVNSAQNNRKPFTILCREKPDNA